MANAVRMSKLAICESVVRALFKSAIGQVLTDVEQVYEYRLNPVTRKREKVLSREKTTKKNILPNPLSCFFYLQNRDSARWSPQGQGARGNGTNYTPEQISTMMRTSANALSDATIGIGLAANEDG